MKSLSSIPRMGLGNLAGEGLGYQAIVENEEVKGPDLSQGLNELARSQFIDEEEKVM